MVPKKRKDASYTTLQAVKVDVKIVRQDNEIFICCAIYHFFYPIFE